MKIRMLVQRTGPRHDGQEWPDRGGTLEVSDEEGAALCEHGDAFPVVTDDVETPQPDTADVEIRGTVTLTPSEEIPDDGGFFPPDVSLVASTEVPADEPAQPDEPAPLAHPIVNSPKAAWVEYAVSLGADRGGAEASSKADVIQWVKDKEG